MAPALCAPYSAPMRFFSRLRLALPSWAIIEVNNTTHDRTVVDHRRNRRSALLLVKLYNFRRPTNHHYEAAPAGIRSILPPF